jgi:5-(carboxyamino)imidazole ribonucleotide synthase
MKKVGILGGGQLGRMLLQAAVNYPIETYLMENDENCPSGHLCQYFFKGDIKSFEEVYTFGKNVDVLSIEIEQINIEALEKLEEEGVKVIPSSSCLKIINNKISQKYFYHQHQIPTSHFVVTHSIQEIQDNISMLPAVHKLAKGGYDGKGVQVLKSVNDISKAFDKPSVLEKCIDIKQEIAIIVAVGQNGQTAVYPAVEMVFDPNLNLLSHQICPAELADSVYSAAESIALNVVKNLESAGLFSVEMFIDKDDTVWVNEIAPRVHNSGHHTIEAHYCSQFDMFWRILLDYPLGNTNPISNSAMLNLVGEANCYGIPDYQGLNGVLSMDKTFVHIYGKKETKPGRKMGHVTILGSDKTELINKVNQIKQLITVKSI